MKSRINDKLIDNKTVEDEEEVSVEGEGISKAAAAAKSPQVEATNADMERAWARRQGKAMTMDLHSLPS
ncbi:hypothetical protein ZIOFF_009459 [Zingiber officinale]|uniref:Uncharacterized protein n=1 Tax=Zingiber officinale TaxID=94328 RepID=A0A8J5LNS7_ZINOF|nr:hypothetical protein ZIOFF_009459 [Zingiber officinale]